MRAFRLQWYLVVLTLTLIVGGCGLSSTSQHMSRAVAPTALPTQTLPVRGDPVRLLIPTTGLNASIEPVGILSNGDMATPTQNPWENVGWYNAGPGPGEQGSAVIDGHLDRPGGDPAIFWRLRSLHVGDEVQVIMTTGKMLHFHVTRIALYSPQAAPLQDIFGNKGGKYLNLITCAGDWIPSQHQTTLRLVVYTSLG